jgi:tetratricopeptide (TPR) repeat protein
MSSDARFQNVLKLLPRRYKLFYTFGVQCESTGASAEAVLLLERAVEMEPESADARNALGVSLASLSQPAKAIPHFEKAAALKPNFAEAHHNLGCALASVGRTDEALAHLVRASQLKPDSADMQFNLGSALLHLGKLAEAKTTLERAIDLDPKPSYFLAFTECAHPEPGNPYVVKFILIEKKSMSLPAEERIKLHFALGNVFKDLGRHDLAFGQWSKGNALKRATIRYDEKATLALVGRIERSFTREVMRKKSGRGDSSGTPVFIVGMLRSGTTLIEQILASHPAFFGAGEVSSLGPLRTQRRGLGPCYPEDFAKLKPEKLRAFGSECVRRLKALAPARADRVIDKMPTNFWFLGLIHLALPNARIIHVRRDPVDTCVSCYSKLFGASPPLFAYDLAELGRYYRAYGRVMEHWRGVLPEGAMLDVQYEDVVTNLETEARRIISYCGLKWDPACLSFHKNGRYVATASAAQVRKPIFRSSIGNSSPYKEFLGPLLEELGMAPLATAEVADFT